MNSLARLLFLVSWLLVSSERVGAADPCDQIGTEAPDDHQWLYVQLVTPDGVGGGAKDVPIPMLKTTKSSSATQPPDETDFVPSPRTKNCFAAAVLKSSRRIIVRAKALGYQSKECEPPQDWKQFTAEKPFRCQMLPTTNGLASSGKLVRLVAINFEERSNILNDVVSESLALDEAERLPSLLELGIALDIRDGVLAQRTLAQLTPKCVKATCVDRLDESVPNSLREWLVEHESDIQDEEYRQRRLSTIRRTVLDKQLRDDIVLIMEDPSVDVVTADDAASVKRLERYIGSRLPADRAKPVIEFAKAGFDPSRLPKEPAPAPQR